MTDVNGEYELSAGDIRVTQIVVSFLGYQSQTIPIQRGVPQVINVALETRSVDLQVAVIRPDKDAVNPAKPLMQRVAEAKSTNNPAEIPALAHTFYEVQEVAINDFQNVGLRDSLGPFSWVWDRLDSTEHRVSLPIRH